LHREDRTRNVDSLSGGSLSRSYNFRCTILYSFGSGILFRVWSKHSYMSERRKNGRVRLTCTVALWDPSEGTVIQTQTENISSEGFYCLSAEPFSPGTRLEAILEIPYRLRAGKRSERLALQCNVHVIRVDSKGPRPLFGVACQIDDYAVVPLSG
jgi:hypothetical protein